MESSREKKLKYRKIFERVNEPFLMQHGFKRITWRLDFYEYRHETIETAQIYYEINPNIDGITTGVTRGLKTDIFVYHQLSEFIDGPANFGDKLRSDEWMFNNEIEFVGVLEKQSQILEEWVFDWMLRKFNFEVVSILKERSIKLTDNKEAQAKGSIELKEWRSTRFYPQKWKLASDLITKE